MVMKSLQMMERFGLEGLEMMGDLRVMEGLQVMGAWRCSLVVTSLEMMESWG